MELWSFFFVYEGCNLACIMHIERTLEFRSFSTRKWISRFHFFCHEYDHCWYSHAAWIQKRLEIEKIRRYIGEALVFLMSVGRYLYANLRWCAQFCVGFFYFEMKIFILFLYQLYILIHLLVRHPCREFLRGSCLSRLKGSVLLMQHMKGIREDEKYLYV